MRRSRFRLRVLDVRDRPRPPCRPCPTSVRARRSRTRAGCARARRRLRHLLTPPDVVAPEAAASRRLLATTLTRAERHRGAGEDGSRAAARRPGRARPPRPGCRRRCRERPEQVLLHRAHRAARQRDRLRRRARRSPRISVTSPPRRRCRCRVPIAMPTSACASAGASLMPSPTIATTRPSRWSRSISRDLALRQHAGHDPLDARLARHRLGGALRCRR